MNAVVPIKFGPVKPAIEMAKRTDHFRSSRIAAMSFGYDTKTNLFDFRHKLANAQETIRQLRAAAKRDDIHWPTALIADVSKTHEELLRRSDGLHEDHIAGRPVKWPGLLPSMMRKMGAKLENIHAFFTPEATFHLALNSVDPDQKPEFIDAFISVRKNIAFMRNFCYDREALAEQRNIPLSRGSLTDPEVLEKLQAMHPTLRIQAEETRRKFILGMSNVRLFTLLNNLIYNSYSKRDDRKNLFIQRTRDTAEIKDPNLEGVLMVLRNERSDISDKLFEPVQDGLIKLVDMPMDETHIRRLRFCEVWDIIAIQKGLFSVTSQPGEFSEFGIWLPTIERHEVRR
ncbi:MAG: hypothetical protein WC527_05230 [Candidatus Margulisiibacteriota bacterium]